MLYTKVTHGSRDQVATVTIENNQASVVISLFGGHVLSFQPKTDNRERLWMSSLAQFDKRKPIRGGIPVCWPWFAAAPQDFTDEFGELPAHGYVRTCDWQVVHIQESVDATTVTLTPLIEAQNNLLPNLHVELELVIAKTLTVRLRTTNSGASRSYYAALHSYFAVSDIHHTELHDLTSPYIDKLQNWAQCPAPSPYCFTSETDRIHLSATPSVTITSGEASTVVNSHGHDSLVVWNPWQDRCKEMIDMSDDSYLTMLCVETARTQANVITQNETHILEQVIR
ncbi:D-hexose-6-phosphate mutarotase [Alteromonas sp. ASW11-36]|uniref:Putative glucose-6-phosphate 1-epimerase n=1 Tax=Alteromonas arenosi TaxID=3055817 RepID=A0ABT7SWP2_9ALTE|nr:D-hexose-6-phosphate mutarotase [Alteromonas sp. ASW11-36]MDM7860602.1 D-hexose-6-phosphate mutarotase [Alteromonas sp. ASW11-36]